MFSLLPAHRKPGWMAILPRDGRVTLVHAVRPSRSRPEIRRLDTFAIESDERGALHRLKNAQNLKSYACTTLLKAGECSLSQMDTPSVPREERKEALRWGLKDLVNYPVESACIDVLDIPNEGLPQGRSAGVLVVSASEQTVRSRANLFDEAGIRLDVIDVPELAQRNVAALLEDENRGLVFLRLDEAETMLTLTFHGELVASRRSDITTLQLNARDEDQRARAKERLVLELQRSLDNFDRQYSHIPVSKVVVASFPHVEHLVGDLRESAYVPVLEMDLSSVLEFSAVPELKNTHYQAKNLLAIGAALRAGEVAK